MEEEGLTEEGDKSQEAEEREIFRRSVDGRREERRVEGRGRGETKKAHI